MRHGVPTPALPLELVIAIIDLLSDDKESLDSCSLVSSQLLSPSRHRLFAHVCVSATEPEWNHEAFAHFLTSTRVIGHHIRSLELDGADDDGETPTFLTSLTLSTILYNLPNLRDLTFSVIEVQQGYLSPHPYPPLTSIRSLCFESAVFETDLRNLFVFLSSFPELRKLDFRELAFIPGDLPNVDGPETHTPALRTVQDLTLGGYTDRDWYPNLLRWCRLRVSLTSITSLDLCLLEAGYAAEMGCMLQEGSNLQSLRLRLSVRFMENSQNSVTEYVDALGLQNCTYLHSFTIYLSPAFLPSPDDSCESWEFLTISLTRLPPYIRHICIGFSDAPNSSSEADQANLLERNSRLPWAPIDASLSAMRCLEHVTFKLGTTIGSDIGGYTMSPSSRNLIRYLLRNTSERGALRFQEVDDVA